MRALHGRRVQPHKHRQCVELIELSSTRNLSGGKIRLFFAEPVVDVRCVAADDQRALLVVATVSGFRVAWMTVADLRSDMHDGEPGTVQASLASVDRQGLRAEIDIGQGVQVLCADARKTPGGEAEVFLGTDSGVTVAMTVSKFGRTTSKAEFRQVRPRACAPGTAAKRVRLRGPGRVLMARARARVQVSGVFSMFRSPGKSGALGQRIRDVLATPDDELLTLSEDGKVRLWNRGSGKCTAERVVRLEEDRADGRRQGLVAFRMALLPERGAVVFGLRHEAARAAGARPPPPPSFVLIGHAVSFTPY